MKKKEKEKLVRIITFLIVVFIFSFLGYDIKVNTNDNDLSVNTTTDEVYLEDTENETITTNTNTNVDSASENLKIHFVDVGQGDSIIIEQNNHYMLIDAGPNSCEETLLNYIDNLNITKFDYVIGTHAHEDHIGSMDAVINKYDVEKVLFPKTTTTTKTFENFATALKNKNLTLYAPSVGEEFTFQDSKFIVVAPNSSSYDNLNNYSLVVKFIYKDTSYLFVGDAETLSESEMLENGIDLSADVLKVGHHGSNTSTSASFLNAVSPKYAVISCGKNNDYGHPKKNIMNRLKNNKVVVYRTDESGSIVLTSDGKNIAFDKEEGSYDGY
jgi:competence protein ComEC